MYLPVTVEQKQILKTALQKYKILYDEMQQKMGRDKFNVPNYHDDILGSINRHDKIVQDNSTGYTVNKQHLEGVLENPGLMLQKYNDKEYMMCVNGYTDIPPAHPAGIPE